MLPRFLSLHPIWIKSGTEDGYKNLLSNCEFIGCVRAVLSAHILTG